VRIPTRRFPIGALAVSVSSQRRTPSRLEETSKPAAIARLYKWSVAHVSDEHLIIVLAALVSIVAYAWYASHGLTLGYGDALSRMLIARRVIVSHTPGLAQLGTTWLPLHTMLMLPLIWNDSLFHSGLAGSIPSMVAYVVASVYLFRIARFLFAARAVAWTSALAFTLNPSVAYMQTTAMSEVPLLCAAVIAIYYMLRWAQSYHALDLVKSAAAVAVGTGIRYDGWALAVALAAFVLYFSWRRQGYRGAEGWGILYGSLAFSGCVAWVIYNAVIFHDPLLFFFFGNTTHDTSYMAQFPSYHKPWLSFELYGYSVGAMVGWMTAFLAVLGLALFLFRYRLRASALPAYALLIPLAYHWLIFYMGIDTILMPELGLFIYWNVRFGLELIPAVTFFVGFLASVRRALFFASLTLIVAFAVLDSTMETPFALREPLASTTYGVTAEMVAKWFSTQYRDGEVLVSYVPNAPVMFFMMQDIPDQNFITDANGGLFTAALAHPQDTVTWIVFDESQKLQDRIWEGLHNRQDWRHYFVLRNVMRTAALTIAFYERTEAGKTGNTVKGPSPGT
jgi:Dolichyl-phosphate-mannose-protein mannosyltransferase